MNCAAHKGLNVGSAMRGRGVPLSLHTLAMFFRPQGAVRLWSAKLRFGRSSEAAFRERPPAFVANSICHPTGKYGGTGVFFGIGGTATACTVGTLAGAGI
jgi:hypothetical protein